MFEKLFEAGNKAQLEKLEENMHKSGWGDVCFDFAGCEILRRAESLKQDCWYYGSIHVSIEDMRKEAANIANFCHMIILKCDKIIGDEEK